MNKIRKNKILRIVLAISLVLSTLCIPAFARDTAAASFELVENASRASGRINITVPAGGIKTASTSFPLETGDIVEINASYSPTNVSFNIGLIAPDGQFYYATVTDGSIDENIEVNQHGYYTLAIENTSNSSVTINGYVNY